MPEAIASLYSIPVPLLEIAKDEGIRVIYDDYETDTFDGMTWYEPKQDKFFIHVNTKEVIVLIIRKGGLH